MSISNPLKPSKRLRGQADAMSPIDERISFAASTPKTFIVQNISKGLHVVNDLNITLTPLQVLDLTWMDTRYVRASQDLKNSLRKGFLVEISQEEYDAIQDAEVRRERASLLNKDGKRGGRTAKKNVNGRSVRADVLDLNRADTKINGAAEVGAVGHDPLAYTTAYSTAQEIAHSRGKKLTAEQFSQAVDADPNLVDKLLYGNVGTSSGQQQRGRVTIAGAPTVDGSQGSPYSFNSRNLNSPVEDDEDENDDEDDEDDEEEGFGEELDIMSQDQSDEDGFEDENAIKKLF